MSEIERLDEGLWHAVRPVVVAGIPFTSRTTIVRLPDGGLFVVSPGALGDALRDEVAALGPVAVLAAPNLLHHLFVHEWQAAFPAAVTWACPKLERKRTDLKIDGTLGDAPEAAWRDVLDQHATGGISRMNEVVFLHRPTRTLIATDLVHHVRGPVGFSTRTFFSACGVWERFAVSRLVKLIISDRRALRTSVDRILEWDFDRALMTHGAHVETGGREKLRDAYTFLRG